jgi:hypothetical protein
VARRARAQVPVGLLRWDVREDLPLFEDFRLLLDDEYDTESEESSSQYQYGAVVSTRYTWLVPLAHENMELLEPVLRVSKSSS